MPVSDLPLSFRFGVFFFVGGLIPNPIDIRFQRVSGLGATAVRRDDGVGGFHRIPRSFVVQIARRGLYGLRVVGIDEHIP